MKKTFYDSKKEQYQCKKKLFITQKRNSANDKKV